MSLDDIQLAPVVLAELFKHSLVDSKNDHLPAKPTATKAFTSLGSNKKNILIIVAGSDHIYLPDDELHFLLGILSACNLTLEDVSIINIEQIKPVNYKLLDAEFNTEKILLFGVSTAQIELPLDFPNYQVQRFNKQVYLTAPLLTKLQSDKSEKTMLWNCLKQIFSI